MCPVFAVLYLCFCVLIQTKEDYCLWGLENYRLSVTQTKTTRRPTLSGETLPSFSSFPPLELFRVLWPKRICLGQIFSRNKPTPYALDQMHSCARVLPVYLIAEASHEASHSKKKQHFFVINFTISVPSQPLKGACHLTIFCQTLLSMHVSQKINFVLEGWIIQLFLEKQLCLEIFDKPCLHIGLQHHASSRLGGFRWTPPAPPHHRADPPPMADSPSVTWQHHMMTWL